MSARIDVCEIVIVAKLYIQRIRKVEKKTKRVGEKIIFTRGKVSKNDSE